MASSGTDNGDNSQRPPLVEELKRMGFLPVDAAPEPTGASEPVAAAPAAAPTAVPAEPAPAAAGAPHAASPASTDLTPVAPPRDEPTVRHPAPPPAPELTHPVPPPAPVPPASARPGQAPPPPRQRGGAHRAPSTFGRHAATELSADDILHSKAAAPGGGWRKALHAMSFGTINTGPSPAQQRHDDLVARATRPVPGCWRIAVLSLKGGVGKTTTTAALGVQLAMLRGDRVVAVDANPDRGTLVEKVPRVTDATVRDLLRERDRIASYSDVRAYTSLSPSRLEVLASDADPMVSQAFSEADYLATIGILERFYSLIITDCGTGLLHSAMSGVLGLADALVVVTSPSLDGARSASATLDWLHAHRHEALVEQSVAVVSSVRPRGGLVDVEAVAAHFAQRCRAVVQVPFDPHLEAGSTVTLSDMRSSTRDAYLELAAAIGDGLP